MHSLVHHQTAIYDAHCNDKMQAAIKLIVPHGLSGSQRLNIYRNNTFITLTEALSITFPVINKLVGNDFFAYMASEFIKENPPLQGPLFEYGDLLSDFLDQFEPVASLPYLRDVATLEWAINVAYHAGDATPLSAQGLSHIAEEEFAELKFSPHPSICLITSDFPIHEIWHGNQSDGNMDEIDLGDDVNVVVIRPSETVEIHQINPSTARFLKSLIQGQNIEEAYKVTMALYSDIDPAKTMITILAMGSFVTIKN